MTRLTGEELSRLDRSVTRTLDEIEEIDAPDGVVDKLQWLKDQNSRLQEEVLEVEMKKGAALFRIQQLRPVLEHLYCVAHGTPIDETLLAAAGAWIELLDLQAAREEKA